MAKKADKEKKSADKEAAEICRNFDLEISGQKSQVGLQDS